MKIALAFAITCLSVQSAFAQTMQPTSPNSVGGVPNPVVGVPNPIGPFGVVPPRGTMTGPGGFTTFGPNGTITRVVANSDGSFTIYSPQGITRLVPNASGGFTVLGHGGVPTQVTPDSGENCGWPCGGE